MNNVPCVLEKFPKELMKLGNCQDSMKLKQNKCDTVNEVNCLSYI